MFSFAHDHTGSSGTEEPTGRLTGAVVRIVSLCTRYPWPVMVAAAVLAIGSAWYVAGHFAIDTDTRKLLPRDLPWRQTELAYEAAFPQHQLIAVVSAPTPELVGIAADRLATELRRHEDRFRSVLQPQSGVFFARSALLFLPPDQLAQQIEELTAARPLLAELAGDPSLRGVMRALAGGLQMPAGGGHQQPAALTRPMNLLSDTLDDVLAGRFASFSWLQLMSGRSTPKNQLRGFVEIEPKLDFAALQPGIAADNAVRRAAETAKLETEFGAGVALTGQAAINDEQFASLSRGAIVNFAGTVLVVLAIMWLALGSPRIIIAVFLSLCAGFAATAAIGLLIVGAFNLISVAFAVLFVGLGADFGIQFSVRYRAERHQKDAVRPALRGAAGRAGGPLALAAAGTMAGFFCFLPTAYRGVSELGQIAGVGMLIAFLATITLLPALLTILNPPGEPHRMGFAVLAPADRFLARHRIAVVAGTIVTVLAGSPLLLYLRFDFDPIHLQDPSGEAVRTYLQLRDVPEIGINSANVAAPSVVQAEQTAQRLAALPEVSQTRTIASLVPSEQDRKLPLIRKAATALEPALSPATTRPPPTDGETVEAIRAAAAAVRHVGEAAGGDPGAAAARLNGLLSRLADADPATRAKAQDALIVPLKADLVRLRNMLRPERVTVAAFPKDLASDWVAPDGRARVEVLPQGDPNDTATLRRFANAVLAAAPQATGMPISLVQSQKTVIWAFVEAGIYALLAIAAILWITLRRLADVLMTLVPLLVAGAVTLEVAVVIGEPLNFANVIALPLLLGVGVAFKIYYIMAWRAGATNLLQSTLTRAVLFSAMTTATAFGSLWLSNQPGMSSMGRLMALALLCTMTAAVLFQPALMGPPRSRDVEGRRTAPEPEAEPERVAQRPPAHAPTA
ncbi:MAG: MMPL family transporter [Alphaproteobacteria bacterium]|nr:MMPL family transporter [Alphaproteobacteria bacterium]